MVAHWCKIHVSVFREKFNIQRNIFLFRGSFVFTEFLCISKNFHIQRNFIMFSYFFFVIFRQSFIFRKEFVFKETLYSEKIVFMLGENLIFRENVDIQTKTTNLNFKLFEIQL